MAQAQPERQLSCRPDRDRSGASTADAGALPRHAATGGVPRAREIGRHHRRGNDQAVPARSLREREEARRCSTESCTTSPQHSAPGRPSRTADLQTGGHLTEIRVDLEGSERWRLARHPIPAGRCGVGAPPSGGVAACPWPGRAPARAWLANLWGIPPDGEGEGPVSTPLRRGCLASAKMATARRGFRQSPTDTCR